MSEVLKSAGWLKASVTELNFYKSASVAPEKHPEEIFELYSVPIFPTGNPEVLAGEDIGSSKQQVEPGDVLLCKINPRINRVWEVKSKREFRQIASSEWIVVRQPLIESSYLRYFFSAQEFRDLLCSDVSGVGGSLTRAQPKRVATYQVPLPPLAEQKEIARRLDDLLARVDTLKTRLDSIPAILKRFRQATLAAACSGRLTADWRAQRRRVGVGDAFLGEIRTVLLEQADTARARRQVKEAQSIAAGLPIVHALPETWSACTVGAIGLVTNGSTPSRKRDEYWNGDIPWVSSGEVRNNRIKKTREGITQAGYDGASVRLLPPGTVLIAMIGEGKTRGQTAILDIDATINQNIAAVDVRHGLVQSEYLWSWFQMIYLETRRQGSGSGPKALNCQRVRELPFALPPKKEQAEIVRQVEELFAFADQIEQRVKDAQSRVNSLTQSMLAKAFRGDLTESWRAANPDLITGKNSAEALLKRIKKEREKSRLKKKTMKKRV